MRVTLEADILLPVGIDIGHYTDEFPAGVQDL